MGWSVLPVITTDSISYPASAFTVKTTLLPAFALEALAAAVPPFPAETVIR